MLEYRNKIKKQWQNSIYYEIDEILFDGNRIGKVLARNTIDINIIVFARFTSSF